MSTPTPREGALAAVHSLLTVAEQMTDLAEKRLPEIGDEILRQRVREAGDAVRLAGLRADLLIEEGGR